MTEAKEALLAKLKPTREQKIMDVVAEAGIDVTPWATKKDGTPVKVPSANPNFCYEWAFGGNGQPSVVCVWHKSLAMSGDQIVYDDNLRRHALSLDRIANTRENPPHVKSRARDQAARARRFDSLLQRAYRTGQQVRVVLLDGLAREEEALGWERSEVRWRELDDAPWRMATYADDSGELRLVRRSVQPEPAPKTEAEPVPPETPEPPEMAHLPIAAGDVDAQAESPGPTIAPFVDQFSAVQAGPAPRHDITGTAFNRSSAVREIVLLRAQGVCEHCGQPGFKTAVGSIFLETHHVIALADLGPDEPWNVVGLCPNDHRRAHHGEERASIKQALVDFLIAQYPASRAALQAFMTTGIDPI